LNSSRQNSFKTRNAEKEETIENNYFARIIALTLLFMGVLRDSKIFYFT